MGAEEFHGRLAGPSPESRRSTSDPRSEVLRRDSGEVPARPRWGLWRYERGVGDAIPPISPKTAKNRHDLDPSPPVQCGGGHWEEGLAHNRSGLLRLVY